MNKCLTFKSKRVIIFTIFETVQSLIYNTRRKFFHLSICNPTGINSKYQPTIPHINIPTTVSTESSSGESDLEDRDDSNNMETSDDDIQPQRRPGRYTLDPDIVPPRNLLPATMIRSQRNKKKPDYYGAWSS